MFNKDVVKCFDQSDPRAALIEVQDKMMGYLSSLAGLVSGHMPAYQTMSIEALLTIDVHSRDIVSNMIGNDITKRDDFEWTKYVHSNLHIKPLVFKHSPVLRGQHFLSQMPLIQGKNWSCNYEILVLSTQSKVK